MGTVVNGRAHLRLSLPLLTGERIQPEAFSWLRLTWEEAEGTQLGGKAWRQRVCGEFLWAFWLPQALEEKLQP